MDTPDWLEFVSGSFTSPLEVQGKPVAEKSEISSISTGSIKAALPTPPASALGSPVDETKDATLVSLSTTFYPAANLYPGTPDLIFLTSDAVFFFTHSARVGDATLNRFNSLLPAHLPPTNTTSNPPSPIDKDEDDVGTIIPVPESSHVLNIVLHAIYYMPCALYHPSLTVITAGIRAMTKYGIPLEKYLAPCTHIYQYLLSQSPTSPIEVYACAAEHSLHDLAVQVSPHLLAFPLHNVTDEDAQRMGPVYLKRMFFQQLGRVEALKRLLLPPPESHAPTKDCGFFQQKKLTRAWALASAYLAWDARPDLSTGAIESALGPLGEHLECEICKRALDERVRMLVVQWALVKRTI